MTTMKPKIAIIGSKGIPTKAGGVERHVEELSSRLVERGFEVSLYTRPWHTPSRLISHRGVRLISIPTLATKYFDTITHVLGALLHAIFVERPHMIHIHGVGPALLAWLPKLFGLPVLITFHCIDRKHAKWGFLARVMLRLGEWCALKFADRTITVSRVLEQYCLEAYDRETIMIPNGVADPGVARSTKSILARLGVSDGRYILMVSRLVPHKGAHTLIAAFQKLPRALREQYELVIVGDGSFTDRYVKTLKALVGRDRSVKLVGARSGRELDALFRGSVLVVHPSTSEGLPIAILEAMSYGQCVLASDIAENREVLQRKFGYEFRTGSVDDLNRKLAWLLRNPDLVQRIGQKARTHVLTHYHWDDIAEATAHLYDELLREQVSVAHLKLAHQ